MRPDRFLPYPLPPDERTIPGMLKVGAAHFTDRPLFRCGDTAWTYADAPQVAARMAGRLQSAGIRAGDRVAILSMNRAEVMAVLIGCGWLGAIAVPINVAVKAPQLRYYLADSGARVLIIEADLLDVLPADVFAGLALERIWLIGASERSFADITVEPFDVAAAPIAAGKIHPGDAFAILYTSGTTGPAKGVICPHAQFYWWGVYAGRFLEVTAEDVLVTALPLFHTNAINCFFQALLHGAAQVVLPRFSASGFWPAMVETGATVGYVLGAMVPILLAQPATPFERQHRLRTALGPGVPASLHEALFVRTGLRLADGFGSTESNFVIGGPASERVPGRMGRLSEGISARVADVFDEPVPDGEAGQLLLRADAPFAFGSGYFGKPAATIEAWGNLWFHTGDRVIRHADGTFAFVDRLKDVIRRRGENISSFEVEQVLQMHPAIEVAAVYPVPSDLAEDEVMAAVVLKPGADLKAPDIVAFCAKNLPKFAVPRYLAILSDLPRTENGKVQKFRLRESGVTAGTYDAVTGQICTVPTLAPPQT